MFVVIGKTGEYSDRQGWIVCYYETEYAAIDHMQSAKCASDKLITERPNQWMRWGESGWGDDKKKPNPYDPDWKADYTGTTYDVIEVPHGNTITERKGT
jgi:hypothetical protein